MPTLPKCWCIGGPEDTASGPHCSPPPSKLPGDAGKTLLVLDTANGDAERLYARLGWRRCGVIPGYALLPGGGLCDTTFYYRTLASR